MTAAPEGRLTERLSFLDRYLTGWIFWRCRCSRPAVDTRIVLHELRAMKKNVTVTLDEDTARWVRIEAARRDTSVSAYLGEVLAERRRRLEGYEAARAVFLGREPQRLRAKGGPLPSRSELHERGPGRG